MKQDFSAASDEQLLLNMRDRNDTRLGLSSPFFENSLSWGAQAFVWTVLLFLLIPKSVKELVELVGLVEPVERWVNAL